VTPPKSNEKGPIRHSRFLSSIGRSRSTTVNSDGLVLDQESTTVADANPYFAQQGKPDLRHHNAGSVPPSPPATPRSTTSKGGLAPDSGKEELARKLRRVASAPNTQGLFSSDKKDRPLTAEMPEAIINKALLPSKLSGFTLAPPQAPGLSPAFRRTYSSNSIKIRNVEVSPSSFDKIKLIGKGDVGKVYLVREKKSNRLYAMKGGLC
jgi:protein-serine/threonine kinase